MVSGDSPNPLHQLKKIYFLLKEKNLLIPAAARSSPSMQPLVSWPRAGASGAGAVLVLSAQPVWCELYDMNDLKKRKKRDTVGRSGLDRGLTSGARTVTILQVEYGGGGRIQYSILFIFSLFYESSNLEYVHIHVIYRVNQAEYGIRILVAASQEYVNTYSTCRVTMPVWEARMLTVHRRGG